MTPLDLFATLDAAEATRQGVGPLAARERRRRGLSVPPQLDQQARQLAAIELVRGRELDTLLARFESEQLPALIIKGTALAYTLYEHPSLRPRCDTDVVIRRADLARARQLLLDCGYDEEPCAGGELVNAQRIFSRVDSFGVRHAIDLHWRTFNRPRLARMFRFDELWSRSHPFRAASHVRIPESEDALLIAAVHLAGHHPGEARLIWLHDLHLLAATADLHEVIARARRKGITRELAGALTSAGCISDRIPVGHTSRLHELAEDFRFAEEKGRFLREHLLPSAEHVMRKYGTTSRLALPFLYVRRALGIFRPSKGLFATIPRSAVPSEKSKPAVRQGRKA